MRRKILALAALLCIALGALFLLQGLGLVRWPASSMMIDQRVWVVRGGVVALIGLALLGVRWLDGRR